MPLDFLYWVAGIMALFFIALGVYKFIQERKELGIPPNAPTLINFMPHQSEGHAEGKIIGMKLGEKRIKITFIATDENELKEEEEKKFFKKYIIYYDKRQVIPLAESELSNHNQMVFAYPSNPNHLPDGIKQKNPEIALAITKRNEMDDENTLLQKRIENLSKIAKKTVGGDMFTDYLSYEKGFIKDILEAKKSDENKPFQNKQ